MSLRREPFIRSIAGLVVGASLVAVHGCAAVDVVEDNRRTVQPALSGPWASEFVEAISNASDFERSVLYDGAVTAEELAEAHEKTRRCMADAGYQYRQFDDGTSEVSAADGRDLPSIDVVNTAMRRCNARFDRSITMLFTDVRRNPQKQDEAKITVACLREAGLVGKDYTERKWRSEYDTGVFSFPEYDAGAIQCRLDPLGLWRHG
jgi:hypothetical protein